ncbi:hypothetical protein [Streptomyces griseiscabiei]|uniref:Uncharacterized protein n=1 Tax=Streptomyces griseiscabiei TaxID=2993540 RepID=A0ABU4LHG4_9ACTN|nr:hypothetical protein [Streptomyces griseiscabiei]MBZ3900076.1 hypothetical protein [Streptomyces griseiscabiei]MDX2914619.1 hypothetical protein [Streptomyces griseiscabiei]
MSDRSTPEEPDLFRVRRPSPGLAAISTLTLVLAADLAGLIPEGPAAGAMLAGVAALALLKGCVRRGR